MTFRPPIPCLGYPSQRGAIIALAARGLDAAGIITETGLSPNVVHARLVDAKRKAGRTGPRRRHSTPLEKLMTDAARDALRPHAARRDLSLPQLCSQLLEAIARDGMVDAILDDEASR